GIWRDGALPRRKPVHHRPGDRPRQRPASRVAERTDGCPRQLTMSDADDTAEATSPTASGLTGPEVIAEAVKKLPNAPGVYRMTAAKGTVLYVGKARSLKKRVANYTRISQTARIARAVQLTAAMEFVSTRTETEALLLEANLIKRLRPRFNVLLRDDKSFPYI